MKSLDRTAFDSRFRVTVIPNEGVFWTSRRRNAIRRGPAHERAVRLVSQHLTREEIAISLEPEFGLAPAFFVLDSLERHGLVINGSQNSQVESPTNADIERVVQRTLALDDLDIVVSDDYLDPALAQVNRKALRRKRSWILVDPNASMPSIGPIFVPGVSGCWECLAVRLRRLWPIQSFLDTHRGAAEILARPARLGASELDTLLASLRSATLVARRLQCKTCGDSRPLASQLDQRPGKQRRESRRKPLSTSLIHPLNGVTADVRLYSASEPSLFRVWVALPTAAVPISSVEELLNVLSQRCLGCDISDRRAIRRAVAEAVERYSGEATGDEVRVIASLSGLGETAVHPNECMLFSERQFADRNGWNRCGEGTMRVPRQYSGVERIEWTPAWSLRTGSRMLVPTALLFRNGEQFRGRKYCTADSNGAAAGCSLRDAIARGLLEVVERDAIAIWWYNRLRRPSIRLADIPGIDGARLEREYRAIGRELWMLDITTDLEIPVIAAVSRRTGGTAEHIMFGFGAHWDPRRAAARALAEMHQMVVAVDYLSEHETALRPTLRRWLRTAAIRSETYLAPTSDSPRSLLDMPTIAKSESTSRFQYCIDLLTRRGFDILIVNQTRPDAGLPVAKVVIPGMRPAVARFAPGRLFDVPVAMGWRSAPTSEQDLNPVPFFL